MKLLLIPLILTLLSVAHGYHYNGYPYSSEWPEAPRYPDYCCPLEWVNITRGQELPKDWIYAGTFMDRNFAFTRADQSGWSFATGVKSSRKEDVPYGYGATVPNPFPILTNPNKCIIDWYTTKARQDIPQSNEIFLPTTGTSKYGSYAQYEGIPGLMSTNGHFAKMKSLSSYEYYARAGVKLLYVDCKKSFQSMYDYKLVNISFDPRVMDKLRSSNKRVQYDTKEFINRSPRETTTSIKYNAMVSSPLNVTISSLESNDTRIKSDTYNRSMIRSGVELLLPNIGINATQIDFDRMEINNRENLVNLNFKSIIDIDRKIIIPAFSKVSITTYLKPVTGTIPMNASFSLIPIKAGDNLITSKMIDLNIDKYMKNSSIKYVKNDAGNYEAIDGGILSINFTQDYDVDVITTPLLVYKLVRFTFDQGIIDKLKSSSERVQYVRKQFSNYSPEKSKAGFKFSVITHDHINMTLSNPGNASQFINENTYANWIGGARIKQLLADVKFLYGNHDAAKMWKIPNLERVSEKKKLDMFGVWHREQFNFKQKIVIPASSKVTVLAYSNPIRGKVPFQALYELVPVGSDETVPGSNLVAKDEKHQVIYDGIMDIDSGNEVHLEIKSSPLNRWSESNGTPIGVASNPSLV